MYTGEFVLFVAILILRFFIRDRPCFSLQNSLMISFTVALGTVYMLMIALCLGLIRDVVRLQREISLFLLAPCSLP